MMTKGEQMPSITWQKNEHREGILECLKIYTQIHLDEIDEIDSLVRGLAVAAMRKMTLEELQDWHAHLETIIIPVEEDDGELE
jgi:hypothetical protein